jgi:hypothetical protein
MDEWLESDSSVAADDRGEVWAGPGSAGTLEAEEADEGLGSSSPTTWKRAECCTAKRFAQSGNSLFGFYEVRNRIFKGNTSRRSGHQQQ